MAPTTGAAARAADALIESTVVMSFTNLGHGLRQQLLGWRNEPERRLDGKTAAITGATSGVGLAAATELARRGASVHLLVRDPERGRRSAANIVAATGNEDVTVEVADLASLPSVRAAAAALAARVERLDVLVHNAGLLTPARETTDDGLERMFATHVAGPFLLQALLAGDPVAGGDAAGSDAPPLLRAGSRVIWVSSGGMYAEPLHLDDLQRHDVRFDGTRVYAHTKRAQVALARAWAERLAGDGVVVHAMHPGWADTPGVADALPTFHRVMGPWLRTPGEGADTIVWLASADEPGTCSGMFWHDRRPRPPDRLPWTRVSDDERRRLFDQVAALVAPAD
ncbi:MAG: SDR family NAD(P)-dependent oxidoreductase [Actinomycetota bacterium]|nr:SDR family NAD(P)-dependent oxidoreductase [Actinomycetota bacterium]